MSVKSTQLVTMILTIPFVISEAKHILVDMEVVAMESQSSGSVVIQEENELSHEREIIVVPVGFWPCRSNSTKVDVSPEITYETFTEIPVSIELPAEGMFT